MADPNSTDTPSDAELPTEFAIGSDGRIYINAESLPPEKREGRPMFQGYAMTPEEARHAVETLHKLAFNITVEVLQATRESSGKE
ncbi:hypothetical protein [Polyangium sp. y55x31]|uniref:hypothetical protein n=1 Tax=Polyangium sp. y55x31 TaxID=3042688 RepID=UPI0024826A86|nr:hypothetical protein [Polyangium sp. y55x31]MDI1484352.1 hypothetical protein [Polyangium sp. y55x31]